MNIAGALTVKQPWAHCIAIGAKRVENRTWAPPLNAHGRWLLIHAGGTYDFFTEEIIRSRGVVLPKKKDLSFGRIVAAVRLERVVSTITDPGDRAILDPWFVGPYGWCFDRIVPVSLNMKVRGKLGVWTPPRNVIEKVLAQHR